MIVDVLNVQAGENLTEILETPASDEQVRLVLIDLSFICWSAPVYHLMKECNFLGGVTFKTFRLSKELHCFSRYACKNSYMLKAEFGMERLKR